MDLGAYGGLLAGAAGGLFRALNQHDGPMRAAILTAAGALAGYWAWPITFAVWSPLWVIVPAEIGIRVSFAQFTAGVVGGVLSGIFTDMTKGHYEQDKGKGGGTS